MEAKVAQKQKEEFKRRVAKAANKKARRSPKEVKRRQTSRQM